MPRKRKTKATKKQIEEFADGKNHIQDEAQQAKNLENVLNQNKVSQFKVSSAEELQVKLDAMTLTQLQEFAVKTGVFPSGSKLTLKNKLIKAFRQETQGAHNFVQLTKPLIEPGSEKEKNFFKAING
jgi:hypothetical protein